MKRLLQLECRKLLRQKSFYICLGLSLAAFLLVAVGAKVLAESNGFFSFSVPAQEMIVGALGSSMLATVAGVFITIWVCDDYEHQIVKCIYSRGYDRTRVSLSKLVSTVCIVTVMYLVLLGVASAVSYILFDAETSAAWQLTLSQILPLQYLVFLAECSIWFCLSMVFRKKAPAIILGLIGPRAVTLLLAIVDSLLYRVNEENITFADYWLTEFSDRAASLGTAPEKLPVCFIGAAIYFVVFSALGIFASSRNEV